MLDHLRALDKVTGVKQSSRAVRSGLARQVFLAYDADPALTGPLEELCRQKDIPFSTQYTSGSRCGYRVGKFLIFWFLWDIF